MKKILHAFILFFCSYSVIAQSFPGDMPQLLLNRQLRVEPLQAVSIPYGYKEFYTTPEMESGTQYKAKGYSTPHEELVGKVFTVTEVVPAGSEKYPRFRLKLQSEGLPVIYYQYNPTAELLYPFELVGEGLKLPDDFYCRQLFKLEDERSTRIESPTKEGLQLIRQIEGKEDKVSLYATALSKEVAAGKTGMTITFTNGKIIKKPEALINLSSNGANAEFLYSTLVYLTPAEVKMLSESTIASVRLHVFDKAIRKGHSIMGYAKCMLK